MMSLKTLGVKIKSKESMNTKFLWCIGAIVALLSMAGCSEHEGTNGGNEQSLRHVCYMKLEVVGQDNGAQSSSSAAKQATRTLTIDEHKDVTSSWDRGDNLFVYNLSDKDLSNETQYSSIVTKDSCKGKAIFEGQITSRNVMSLNDKLAFFYPGDAVKSPLQTVAQVDPNVEIEAGQGGVNLKYHISREGKIKSTVSLDMKRQDGKLATIDKKYDFNWGVAKPKSLNATRDTIKRLEVLLERKVAFWGMKFKDADHPTQLITDIDSIKINGLRSFDVFNLSDGSFVGTDEEKEHFIDVVIDKSTFVKELKQDSGFVYVAFLAENQPTNFTITVYTPNGIYTKSATKDFQLGSDYRTNLTVNKIKPKPYVEVNGVKWATGNFIRYVNPTNPSNVYWGVAPAQWWISNYGENPGPENKWANKDIKYSGLGSQSWYIDNHIGEFTQTINDLDLFQWGVIDDALKFNNTYYLQGTNIDLQGKYYSGRGGWITVNQIFNRSQATHGDIVKYYTEDGNHHYHYQYPSKDNLSKLEKATTILPAFCYTDKGSVVYGAYFSDIPLAGNGNKAKFPTGRRLWKYQDVTGLVLANKGVFLPIAGRRPIGYPSGNSGKNVEFRHVNAGSGFYAQYYTSECTTYTIPETFFFGAAFKVNFAVASKDQAASIRPVYVGAVNNDETKALDAANFGPFQHILKDDARFY